MKDFWIKLLKDIPKERHPKKWPYKNYYIEKGDTFIATKKIFTVYIGFSCGRVFLKKGEYEVIG